MAVLSLAATKLPTTMASEERLLALLVKSQQGLLEDAQKAGLQTPTIVALARRLKPDVLDPEHALVLGEGFRMPSGVRKPPKHEPAGLRCWYMGISCFVRLRSLRSWLGSAVYGGLVLEICRPADGGSRTWVRLSDSSFPLIRAQGAFWRLRRSAMGRQPPVGQLRHRHAAGKVAIERHLI